MEQGSQISSSIQSLTKDKEIRYSDEELIIRFQDGDEQAFVELVNRYRNRLMTFVCGYVFDKVWIKCRYFVDVFGFSEEKTILFLL